MQKVNTTLTGVLKKVLIYLAMIAIWELCYRVLVIRLDIWKVYQFPSPVDVIKTGILLIRENILLWAVLASLKRILIGYSVSVIAGISMGLILVNVRWLGSTLNPLILGLQTLPSICWLPFAVLWYGLSEMSIIFVIAIGSAFGIALAVENAIKNVNPLFIRAARTMGARGIGIYWRVIFPASLPQVITGLKQGWSFAWRALMAGEMLSATVGLGQVLMTGRELADISQVVCVMVVIVIIGVTVDRLVFGRIEGSIRKRWGLGE